MDESTLPSHCPMTQFPIIDGELAIGGIPATQLAARVGSTPFYAYDRKLIIERIAALRRHLPENLFLHYAIKANPMPALLGLISRHVNGLDVSSWLEMTRALDTGILPEHISFSGPGKTDKELSCAVAAGVIVNVESLGELARVIAAGEKIKIAPKIAIRVNPDFELKGLRIKMGGSSQFGVDAAQVPSLLSTLQSAGLECAGFHLFAGSQNLHNELVIEIFRNSLSLVYRLSQGLAKPPASVKIGGGFGIPYFPGDKPLDLPCVGSALRPLLAEAAAQLQGTRFVMELGRYMVGEAGVYICRVIDVKDVRGHRYVVTDGGMHHHLAASGNFGQVIRRNYPVAVANKMASLKQETVSVVGPLCTSLDLLADKMALAPVKPGDLIAIFQSGAYGPTASPIDFLSHPKPVEILV